MRLGHNLPYLILTAKTRIGEVKMICSPNTNAYRKTTARNTEFFEEYAGNIHIYTLIQLQQQLNISGYSQEVWVEIIWDYKCGPLGLKDGGIVGEIGGVWVGGGGKGGERELRGWKRGRVGDGGGRTGDRVGGMIGKEERGREEIYVS